MKPAVLFSLHDITPFHQERIARAEALFEQWGITQIAYLLVPKYHRGHDAGNDPSFREFCQRKRSFRVDWLLHGYYHLETDEVEGNPPDPFRSRSSIGQQEKKSEGSLAHWWKRKFMTAGEGEFLALDEREALRRLALGQDAFEKCLGFRAEGFIPPAWLHSSGLFGWLKRGGFAYSENHHGLQMLQRDSVVRSPVVTWATRTWLRRKGSLVVCPALTWWHEHASPLRVAMHPFDFDHPETICSMEKVVRSALEEREVLGWQAYLG